MIDINKYWKNSDRKKKIIHNITNYVTSNDVANMILAYGASPIMADEPLEVEEVTKISNGLHINTGTIQKRTVDSMLISGKCANQLNKTVLLDPVGVGISNFRKYVVEKLLNEVQFDAIRGNASEIKVLFQGFGNPQGVDVSFEDRVTEENMFTTLYALKELALKFNTVVAMTGEIDLITDGYESFGVYNGRAEMELVTGTGCQLSGLATTLISENPEAKLYATVTSLIGMGVAGEMAFDMLEKDDGSGSYRSKIIDVIYRLDGKTLMDKANYKLL